MIRRKNRSRHARAVVARNILEISTVAEGQNNRLKKYEEELGQIRERIQTYKDKISLNEEELGKLQNELKEKRKSYGSDRPLITENLPVWSH